jgi:hypothetical protein
MKKKIKPWEALHEGPITFFLPEIDSISDKSVPLKDKF